VRSHRPPFTAKSENDEKFAIRRLAKPCRQFRLYGTGRLCATAAKVERKVDDGRPINAAANLNIFRNIQPAIANGCVPTLFCLYSALIPHTYALTGLTVNSWITSGMRARMPSGSA
jgi:hypothetical protein